MSCQLPACDGVVRARGLCGKHYQRFMKTGSVDPHEWLRERRITVLGDVAEIELTRSLVAQIDAQDVALVSGYRWFATPTRGGLTYAQASLRRLRGIVGVAHMHRLITGAVTGQLVDHINGDGLDNRRANLRTCTVTENMRNTHTLPANNTSGYLGVSWRGERGLWRAHVTVASRMRHLGYFEDPAAAARARDAWLRAHHPSEFWTFNFPMPGERGINRERTSA